MQLNVERQEEKSLVEKPIIRTQSLSLKEEEVLKKRLALLEDIRDGREIVQGVNYDSKDPKQIESEIAQIRRELEFRSVKAAVGTDRDSVLRELKILESDLRKDMPSWDFYTNTKRRDGIAYLKLKNTITKWETDPVRKAKIKRWKFLRRRLDPTDKQIADTMFLFEGTKDN